MGALYRDWIQTGNNVCFRVYQFWLYTIRAEVGENAHSDKITINYIYINQIKIKTAIYTR